MDNSLDIYNDLLERLESFARQILEVKLRSVQEAWQFEIDLLKFQLKDQRKLKEEQNHRREVNGSLKEVCRSKQKGWEEQRKLYQDELEQIESRANIYRHALDIARKIGDTLAWIFLDRIQIISRTRDASMPSSRVHRIPDGHGLEGMLAIAEVLCSAGAGFPILHDLTNCLRIGDITFFDPGGNPQTIEVKTRLKRREGERMVLAVKIHLVNTPSDDAKWDALFASFPKEISLSEEIVPDDLHTIQEPHVMEAELLRQLERMGKIMIWQSAQDGKLFQLGERTVGLTSRLTPEGKMEHYDILQALADEAKSRGFAWHTVDDAIIYTAIYRDTPLWLLENPQQVIPEQSIPSYQQAGLSIAFPEPEKEKNILRIYNIFHNPAIVRPFFTYPLSADTIIDLMWQRMQVIVTINLGKIVEALRLAGLHARLPKNEQEFEAFFIPISMEIALPDRQTLYGKFSGLQLYGAQIAYEFLSLQGFVNLISHTVEMTAEQAGNGLPIVTAFQPNNR